MSRKTRKLMWSVPLIAAVAVIGALAAFMTLTPSGALAQDIIATGKDLPGPVQNLVVEANPEDDGGIPQQELRISWDEPVTGGVVVSYRIDYSVDGEQWFSYIDDHGSSDLRVIYGDETDVNANEYPLMANEERHFRVFAFNQQGTGPGVTEMGTTDPSVVPEPVTDLTAVAANVASDLNNDGDVTDRCEVWTSETDNEVSKVAILLSWTPPMDPYGAPVTHYRIEYSANGTRWFNLETEAKVVKASDPATPESGVVKGTQVLVYLDSGDFSETGPNPFEGLGANTERHYRIFAVNSVGQSLVSTQSASAVTSDSVVPGDVTVLEYILLSPDSTDVRLKWDEPDDPCGDPVTHYQVQAKSGASYVVDTETPANATNFETLTNLTNVEATADTSTVTIGGDEVEYTYLNVTPGLYMTRANDGEYFLTGDDLARAKAVVSNPDNGRFVSGYPVDIRIKPKNRKGLAAEWFNLENVPVGDPGIPRKQGRPNVQQEQTGNEGRSRLKVSWPAATFNEGKAPPAVALDVGGTNYNRSGYGQIATANKVRYILEIKGGSNATSWTTEADDQSDRWFNGHDAGAAPTGTNRYHVDNPRSTLASNLTTPSVQVTYDGALRSGTKREYRLYAIRVPADLLMTTGTAAITFGFGGTSITAQTDAGHDLIRGFRSDVGSATTARSLLPGKPMSLAATSDGHTEVDLTWNAPADSRTLEMRANACRYSDEAATPTYSDVSLRLGLPNDTTGVGAESYTQYGDGNECNDTVIKGYKVEKSTTGTSGWTMVPPTDEECTGANLTVCGTTFMGNAFTVIDLEPAQRYYFRVSTVNTRGVGQASDHESAKTDEAGIPTEPGGLVAQADGPNTITLCWYDHNALDPLTGTSEVRDEGLPVLGYRISYVMYDAEGEETGEMDLVADTRSKITTYTDPTTLEPGTKRTYRVRAITLGGESNPAEASATTQQAAPSGVMADASYDSATMMHSITVRWDAPGADSAITGYAVERAYMMDDGMMSAWMAVDPAHMGTDAMYMDDNNGAGLMQGTMYYYRVRSMISTTPSAWSDMMSETTARRARHADGIRHGDQRQRNHGLVDRGGQRQRDHRLHGGARIHDGRRHDVRLDAR